MTYKKFYTNHDTTKLFCESFGDFTNPCVLLIQGNSAQGLFWRDSFCWTLSNKGFFVLRYDHRDTGLSSKIDFENSPYSLEDLSADAIMILDYLNIEKAHIIGSSMGGYIAQTIACKYPERALSITSMMSSVYSLTMDLAFSEDLKIDIPFLSDKFLESISSMNPIIGTDESQIDYLLTLWKIYNGNGSSFNVEEYKEIAKKWISKNSINTISSHSMAVKNSVFDRSELLCNLKTPYLIIHGDKDPFFPIEHALKQHEIVKDSDLFIVEGMGHLFHSYFDDIIISKFVEKFI